LPYTIQRTTSIPSTYCPQNSNCFLPPIDACHPPLAEAPTENSTNDSMLAAGTTALGGYIKIEMNLASSPGTWKDVTEEILAQGISRDMAAGTMDTMPAATLGLASNGSLAASTYYYYVVTALGAWGESAGTEASIKTGSSNKKVTLTWSAVSGATGYNVYRGNSAGGETGYIGGAACGTTPCTVSGSTIYTDTGATALTAQTPPAPCTNTAIIHLEEEAPAADTTYDVTLCAAGVGNAPVAASCPASGWSTSGLATVSNPENFVPINMYDAREGEVRDSDTQTTPSLNGIMNLVEVDVGNLSQWFAGNIATSGKYAYNGPDALNNSGYILYVSDRRMNCNDGTYDLEGSCTGTETGEFGNEDIINPSVQSGAPNGALDAPEDVDGTGVLYTYGAYAHPITTPTSVSPSGVTVGGTASTAKWPAIISALANSATENPVEVRITANQAQINSVVTFRRALRLVNGTAGNLPPLAAAQATTCSGGTAGGFTVASENPIYVAGDYNASSLPTGAPNGFNDVSGQCHVPASVMGDSVTLLSNDWTLGAQPDTSSPYSGDANSFANPTNPNCNNSRCATTTYYRTAIMGGKNNSFSFYSNGTTPLFAGLHQDFGTDGGVHNFLRYDEDWSNAILHYLGSMASFYISRQGTGVYKCCNTVYNPPATRDYTFDTDFQNINKLPPGTPRFTDVNALSYYQSILPSQ